MILALLACAATERGAPDDGAWTPEAAVIALRDRADTDHDGRLVAVEWDRHAPYGPSFARVDADGDGAVSTQELVRLARGVDPAAWLEATARTQPGRRVPVRRDEAAAPAVPDGTGSPPARPYLQALRADLLAGPACGAACLDHVPTEADIDALGDAPLDTAAVRGSLDRLRGAYTRAGRAFPRGL